MVRIFAKVYPPQATALSLISRYDAGGSVMEEAKMDG
jgi:hypothetical protein